LHHIGAKSGPIVVAALFLMFVSALAVSPVVHATGYTVDQTWCTSVGGIWTLGSYCTAPPITIKSGDSLDVPSGVTLTASVTNNGVITIEGTLLPYSVNNYGTFTVQSSGTAVYGQTFTNYGSVSVAGSAYLGDYLGATFTNYGTFTDTGTLHIDGSFYEECGATFESTPNLGVGTYYPPTGCTTTTSTTTTTTTTSTTTITTTTSTTTLPLGVPEFPFGLALLFALMVPLMLVLRKMSLSPRSPRV